MHKQDGVWSQSTPESGF